MLGFLKKLFLPDELATPAQTQRKTPAKAAATKAAPRAAAAPRAQAGADLKSDDAALRLRAIPSIDDLTVLADRAKNDADTKVRQLAHSRLKTRLLDGSVAVSERIRTLSVLDAALIETVAKSAPEADLRRAAFERINRVGFLGDRVLADPDPAIRMALLGRIDALATLERIAELSRTKDKVIYRAASEKLAQMRFDASDPGEIERRAQILCNGLEALLRNPPEDAAVQAENLQAQWQKLSNKAAPPEALMLRFNGAARVLERILNPPPAQAVPAETDAPVVLSSGLDLALADILRRIGEQCAMTPFPQAAVEALQQQVEARLREINPSPEDLQAHNAVRAQVNEIRARLRAEQAAVEAEHKQVVAELVKEIRAFSQAVDAGDLTIARALEKALDAKKSVLAKHLDTAQKRDLGDAKAKLGKLLGWERWSANAHRIELCEQAEALAGSGLHPDALQSKIAELKQRWAELDRLDGLDEQAAKELGIARRFRALCFAAIKPAQGYFDSRKALRNTKKEETEILVQRALALLATPEPASEGIQAAVIVDAKALLDARADLSERMRNLDQLEPKARAVLSKRIREINDRLSVKLNEIRAEAQNEKRKLLARLRRDLIGAEPAAAVSVAKAAQAQWKTMARGDRKVEDELWNELRSLVDPHFAAMKQSMDQRRQAEQDYAAAGDDIIARTRALVAEVGAEHSVSAALEKLENEWRAHTQVQEDASKTDAASHGRDDRGPSRDRERPARGPKTEREQRERERAREKERAFEAALSQVREAVQAQDAAKLAQQKQLQAEKSEICLSAERAWLSDAATDVEALRARFDALGTLPSGQETPLRARLQRALDGISNKSAIDSGLLAQNVQTGEQIAMALEYLQGRESPEALKAERMQYQVGRLSTKLSQGSSETAAQEIARLQAQWLALGPLTEAERAILQARIQG